MNLVRLLRWPENEQTGLVPWFTVLRRLLFIIPAFVGMGITWLSLVGAYGLNHAMRWWSDAK